MLVSDVLGKSKRILTTCSGKLSGLETLIYVFFFFFLVDVETM